MKQSQVSLWGIILAGGEGERLKEFVCERFGFAIPKQFCAFIGRRSMLEHTIRRTGFLIPSERLVVSGTAHHQAYVFRHLGSSPPDTVLLQPANRDTGPGILFPLVHVLRTDPDAVVAILPADHFILPGRRFMLAVSAASKFVTDNNIEVPVLLAVKPDHPEPEYGWIEPGECVAHDGESRIRRINHFIEKPPRELAEQLLRGGWLWNTMVIVVRAKALMTLTLRCLPDLAGWFAVLQECLGRANERKFVEEMYRSIPKVNFSSSVLAHPGTRSLVLPVQDVCWSDWGTKERILETTRALDLIPSVAIQTQHASVMGPI
jgi:mannose-1-phosphate guanylyltransferase